MNRGPLPTLLLVVALFGVALYYSEVIQRPFQTVLAFSKSAFHDTVERVQDTIDEHFYQQETIRTLKSRLADYRNEDLILSQLKIENKRLLRLSHSKLSVDPRVELVRVLSYAKFGDNRKLLLEADDLDPAKSYGLVYKDLAAGIAVSSQHRPLALLNGDPKCTYAVFVGEKNAPGIVHGNNSDRLVVKFIPTWIEINEGDDVITSGLDNLFFYGLKVGKVLSITLSEGYQSAIIKPYYLPDQPDYFHLIRQFAPQHASE